MERLTDYEFEVLEEAVREKLELYNFTITSTKEKDWYINIIKQRKEALENAWKKFKG